MKVKYPKHLFHVLNITLWPFFFAIGLFFFVTSIVFSVHYIKGSYSLLILSIMILILVAAFWFLDISREAVINGDHSIIVRKGLKMGFLFFIASEVMLFFGFFGAFFHSALCPSIELGGAGPPLGYKVITVFDYPFFNTLILIISGFSVTGAHRGISMGYYRISIDGLILTIFLGLIFIVLQGLEYYEATFNLSDGVYASVFFLLTGLHGCHVIAGVIFLCFAFLSLIYNHFLTTHYLRFVLAVGYWHFVDIVGIILFITLYGWGSW